MGTMTVTVMSIMVTKHVINKSQDDIIFSESIWKEFIKSAGFRKQ